MSESSQSNEWERLRIYLGEDNTVHHRSLYYAIVAEARKLGLAGGTVFRGTMGFGGKHGIRSSRILSLSEDLPMLVEIIDTPQKLKEIMPFLEENLTQGLVTLEKVEVVVSFKK